MKFPVSSNRANAVLFMAGLFGAVLVAPTDAGELEDVHLEARDTLRQHVAPFRSYPLEPHRKMQSEDPTAVCVDSGLEYQSCIVKVCLAQTCYTDQLMAQDDDDDFAESILQDDDTSYDICNPASADERCAPLTALHGDCCSECYVPFVTYTNCISAEIFEEICPNFVPCPIDESITSPAVGIEDDDSIVGDFNACDALEAASVQCLESSCSNTEACEVDGANFNFTISAENCGLIEESYCDLLGSTGDCCGGACREEVAAVVNCYVQVSFGSVCPGIECGSSGTNFEEVGSQGGEDNVAQSPETASPTLEGSMREVTGEKISTIQPSSTEAPT